MHIHTDQAAAASTLSRPRPCVPKLWTPKRVLITPAARAWEHGRAMAERAASLGADVVELKNNRLADLSDDDPRRAYIKTKSTLAIVTAPPSKLRLQPIAPSADWRVDLAEGCPAHCQYCYFAGSLTGPPITRAYANLPEILDNLATYLGRGTITSRSESRAGEGTTFEASCYTDPLGVEHLTGSLAATIRHFGAWDAPVQLRFTTKFDAVEPLLDLPHGGRTRIRYSVNAEPVARRFEGGTACLAARLQAIRRAALAGYPIGLTIAPIMPITDWRDHYDRLLADAQDALADIPGIDLTAELITHRFTPSSRATLLDWYPGTALDMEEAARTRKTTKFGGAKYVYPPETMTELRGFLERRIADRLPEVRILYWT